MLDKETIVITIDRLHLRACHGVLEQERTVGNEFEVTVRLSYPPALRAAHSDELSETVNYAEIVDDIKAVMATPSRLIEHVCGRLRDALLERYPECDGGMVQVTKLSPPIPGVQLAGASACITW